MGYNKPFYAPFSRFRMEKMERWRCKSPVSARWIKAMKYPAGFLFLLVKTHTLGRCAGAVTDQGLCKLIFAQRRLIQMPFFVTVQMALVAPQSR